MKNPISGSVCYFLPLPFSIFLSVARTEFPLSVPLPLCAPESDKSVLSSWPGWCYAGNRVYGPSTEYMSIPIAHDNRDRAAAASLLISGELQAHWCRAGAPCFSETGGRRGSVYFSLSPSTITKLLLLILVVC